MKRSPDGNRGAISFRIIALDSTKAGNRRSLTVFLRVKPAKCHAVEHSSQLCSACCPPKRTARGFFFTTTMCRFVLVSHITPRQSKDWDMESGR